MSSKVILGTAAVLTGAFIYERNKSPAGPVTPEDLHHWKSSQYNTEYPSRGSSTEGSLKKFAREVDAGQYDGRQRLFEHERQARELGHSYRVSGESKISNIKQGIKEDLLALSDALVGRPSDYSTATHNVKENVKGDINSLKEAVFNTKDEVKNYAKDTWRGNKAAVKDKWNAAGDKVDEVKDQWKASADYSKDEVNAINKNKNIMSGFGENAAFFANEQYEDVNGAPAHRFDTKDLRVGMLDVNGKKLTAEDIRRIERNAMRGYGDNAAFFAEEQYQKGKESVDKLAADGSQKAQEIWDATKDKAEDVKEDVKDAWYSAKNKAEDVKEDAKDSWFSAKSKAEDKKEEAKDSWFSTKSKAQDVKEDVKQDAREGWFSAKSKAEDVKEDAKDSWFSAKSKAEDKKEDVKDSWFSAKSKAEDKTVDVKENVKDAWYTTKDKVQETGEQLKDNLDDAQKTVNKKANSWWSWGSKKADEVADTTKENYEWTKAKAGDVAGSAKNDVLDVADKTLEYTAKGFSTASKTLEEQRDFINDKKN